MTRIIVIDADGGVHRAIVSALEAQGWQVSRAGSVADVTPPPGTDEAVVVAAQPGNPGAALAEAW